MSSECEIHTFDMSDAHKAFAGEVAQALPFARSICVCGHVDCDQREGTPLCVDLRGLRLCVSKYGDEGTEKPYHARIHGRVWPVLHDASIQSAVLRALDERADKVRGELSDIHNALIQIGSSRQP